MELPVTKYHPDPVATGSVAANFDTPCLCCNKIRGYVYTGPAYSEKFHYLSGRLCPWCVADGSAAERFKAEFTDAGTVDGVSDSVLTKLTTCTPGFTAWQQEQWLTCCNDAAAFLGRAGDKELQGELAAARLAVDRWMKDEYGEVFALDKEGEPTAYVFRCLHCAKYLAYTDEA